MRRLLLIPALLGVSLLAGDASACCHKKKAACAPAPVCEVAPAPAPCPAPVAECVPAKKHGCFGHMKMPKFGGGLCHKKKAVCAPAPVECAAPAPCAPCGAPMGSPQVVPTGQA
jgi:hypothetical protein